MNIPFFNSKDHQLPGWRTLAAGAGAIGVAIGGWLAYFKFFNGSDSSGPDGTQPYEEWSKEDLYERAQEIDIPGRSNMTKDELIVSLRESS